MGTTLGNLGNYVAIAVPRIDETSNADKPICHKGIASIAMESMSLMPRMKSQKEHVSGQNITAPNIFAPYMLLAAKLGNATPT